MREIDVWENALRWGLEQNPTLLSIPESWSDDDVESMKNTLRGCLPFVRFFSIVIKRILEKSGTLPKTFE